MSGASLIDERGRRLAYMIYLERVKEKLDILGIKDDLKFVGCDAMQISFIEEKVKKRLPAVYKEFLLWMGHSSGALLAGSRCSYQDLFSLQDDAIELLQESDLHLSPPENPFVFLMHQGYQFCFFNTDEGDDPPVYWYIEGQGYFKKTFDHFSEFLMDVVNGYAHSREQMNTRIKANTHDNPKLAERLTELAKALDTYDDQTL